MTDAEEKLAQAEEWLKTYDPASEKWLAAWEHAGYVYRNTKDCELKSQALRVMKDIMGEDFLN